LAFAPVGHLLQPANLSVEIYRSWRVSQSAFLPVRKIC
jgi:hypothetical protein